MIYGHHMRNKSVVGSAVLCCAVVCWSSRLWEVDNNRVNKLICEASNVVCAKPDSLTEVSERRIESNLWSILHNPSHCLPAMLEHVQEILIQPHALQNATGNHSYLWPSLQLFLIINGPFSLAISRLYSA